MPSKIVKVLSLFLLTNLIGLLCGCQELTLYKDRKGIYGFDPMTLALFEVDAKNRFHMVHQFTQAEGKPLAVLRDGTSTFYGICQHRQRYVLFRYSQGKLSYLQSFSHIISDEFYPFKPVLTPDHRILYLIVPQGKTPNAVVLDACTLRGQCRVLHHFGRTVPSDLLLGHDGTLYGTAYYVVSRTKAPSGGLLFQYNQNAGFRILHRFKSVEGWEPGNLILGANGSIYGITGLKGRYGAGTLFEYAPRSRRFRVLYAFPKEDEEGVFLSAAGRNCLYGGSVGGIQGKGYLFSYNLKQDKMSVLHRFTSNEGVISALVLGGDGNLYGTTDNGGKYKEGILFQCSPLGRYRVLHVFNPSEGDGTKDALIWSNARLYVTVVSPLETEAWLYSFEIRTHVLRSLHHFSTAAGNTA
ncbi:MAG TPA: choice-of-anchor tandem repeat GloVer-containing protein [Chthonomonas sp.]|uniref:choice-of-anchor tandem repeat GloVer-containing protein n=1 Tax=Chthonomonas sp. TaxID=2282153 RepID=UPI002B4B2384|nr:choice-of-anchor tandem repeat GloVer-containing protein [Chthonomonas sp.]HLI47422.1 choice-of-anchor tandem repeat GloVer-containing protein [Chthonomonas sp.]